MTFFNDQQEKKIQSNYSNNDAEVDHELAEIAARFGIMTDEEIIQHSIDRGDFLEGGHF